MLNDQDLAAVALTSRLVDSAPKPLSAREYWALRRSVEPSALHGKTATEIASEFPFSGAYAERIALLVERVVSLAIALEKLDHSGIWTITAVGQGYPERLRARLGDSAPVVLHGVGDISLLDTDGVGVVGSRDTSTEGLQVARVIAESAVTFGLPVVSGAARGVDSEAMNAAFDAGGQVIGVPADSLDRVVARRSIRRGVAKGRICLITPYTPAASFSAGNAMGRNKIIYGLSRCTVVVTSDLKNGGTWAGATEALKNGYGVASWTGAGSGAGNSALVQLGAREMNDLTRLGELLQEPVEARRLDDEARGDQLTLGF